MSDRRLTSNRRTTIKALGALGALAAGVPGNAAAHDGPHTITITGNGERAAYEFSVSDGGRVEKSEEYGATINSGDTIDGTTVIGTTTAEPDSYEFEGRIEDFSASAPVSVAIDGTQIGRAASSSDVMEDDAKAQAEAEDEHEEDEAETDDLAVDESDYSNVVNMIEAGADNSGNSSILSIVRDVADDDTLLKFPSGTYLMDGQLRIVNYDRFGMVGMGDVTIDVAPTDGYVFKLGTYRRPTGHLHVENFTADISASNTGGRIFECQAEDSLYVSDITINGEHDTPSKGPLLAGLQSGSGEGTVQNYRALDGGADTSAGRGGTGLLVSHYNQGTLTISNVDIGPFPDNGVYCSNTEGTIHVEDSYIENANVAGVRLAGDDSSIEGCEFVYNEDIPGFDGQRAIRLDYGSDLLVADCDITMDVSITEAIRVMSEVESATIENVDMDLTSKVRDGISIVGNTDVTTNNISAAGMSRDVIYEY